MSLTYALAIVGGVWIAIRLIRALYDSLPGGD